MKKVSKAILIALAVLAMLGGALAVGLHFYLQSPGAQARIQQELSKALRLPLKITKTSVAPWSGLKMSGLSIPDGDANFLEAPSFSASYRLFPLLRGKLIITEMRVESPKIVWAQDAEGQWKLPAPEKAAAAAQEQSPTPAAETPAPTSAPPSPEKKNFAVIVERFEVRNGSFDLLNRERQPVALLTGVNLVFHKLSSEEVAGTAALGKAIGAGGWTLENVRAPFGYRRVDSEFSAPDLTATLAGGTLRASYQSRADAKHVPFTAKLDFANVSLDQLMTQTGGVAGQAIGELRGNLELRGETDRFERTKGEGRLELRDGQFRQLELFQNIGQILGLRELANLRLKESHADLRFGGEKIYVERLLLATDDLQLSSKGVVKFDKKVALDAQLSVNESLVKQLPEMVRDSFTASAEQRRTIDFNISGSTEKLKTNLLDKLVGQKINAQFGDLIGSIFGGDRKEEDKKKKEEEERKKAEKKEKKKKDKDKGAAVRDAAGATPGLAQLGEAIVP